MRAALLGKKLGMTSLYTDDGRQLPCTVIEAGPCSVVQIKNSDKDGYSAVQIGYGEVAERHLNNPRRGHFKKAGVEPRRHLKEFRNPENEYKVGDQLTVEQFQPGDKVRISATSIGRGFQGVVKRHHFGGVGMTTHGQSDRQRHPGSVGQSSYPSRIFKGIRMAGQMGSKRTTVRNLEVIETLPDQNLILIRGSVPGPKNSIVEIVKQ
ncbi:MAG: 50S ribosomal protein L3 [Candidatus Kapaibacterium sp.]